jgi:hypothetical protein
MKARNGLLLAGSLWEIVRFFLVISLTALVLHPAGGAGPGVLPWLLLGGSGNLLVAVGGIMLALFPEKHEGLVGLLRLGKILGIFTFLLLILSGAMRTAAGGRVLDIGLVAVPRGSVLLAVFVLDLLLLGVLLSWRRGEGQRGLPPGSGGAAPEYTEAEVKDYH